jgi:hypothetical protein
VAAQFGDVPAFFPVWLLAVPFTELAKKIGASLL